MYIDKIAPLDFKIYKYRSMDKKSLVRLMEVLHDYLVEIDTLHRLLRLPDFGEIYADALLQKIKESDGIIYLAKRQREVVGMVAGIIVTQSEEDRVGLFPSKAGRILELIVTEKQRHQGIGSALMKQLEDYFVEQHCDIIRVEVFEPNNTALSFYKKLRYFDRSIDMVKLI